MQRYLVEAQSLHKRFPSDSKKSPRNPELQLSQAKQVVCQRLPKALICSPVSFWPHFEQPELFSVGAFDATTLCRRFASSLEIEGCGISSLTTVFTIGFCWIWGGSVGAGSLGGAMETGRLCWVGTSLGFSYLLSKLSRSSHSEPLAGSDWTI